MTSDAGVVVLGGTVPNLGGGLLIVRPGTLPALVVLSKPKFLCMHDSFVSGLISSLYGNEYFGFLSS